MLAGFNQRRGVSTESHGIIMSEVSGPVRSPQRKEETMEGKRNEKARKRKGEKRIAEPTRPATRSTGELRLQRVD